MFCPIIDLVLENETVISDIKNEVNLDLMNYSTFGLRDKDKNARVLDKNIRSSRNYISLMDDKQVNSIKALINKININKQEHTNITFSLENNEMNIIQYEKGDHFEFHRDQPVDSKNNNSYTMVIVLYTNSIGGEIVFDFENPLKYGYIARYSNIPNGVVIFNKNIYHKVLPVKKGKRLVATVNLRGGYYSTVSRLLSFFDVSISGINIYNYLIKEEREMTISEYNRNQFFN